MEDRTPSAPSVNTPSGTNKGLGVAKESGGVRDARRAARNQELAGRTPWREALP